MTVHSSPRVLSIISSRPCRVCLASGSPDHKYLPSLPSGCKYFPLLRTHTTPATPTSEYTPSKSIILSVLLQDTSLSYKSTFQTISSPYLIKQCLPTAAQNTHHARAPLPTGLCQPYQSEDAYRVRLESSATPIALYLNRTQQVCSAPSP